MPRETPAAALPNLWHLYNLRESPFFQDTLGSTPVRHPLSLFVDRDAEARQLLAVIGGSGSSRQAIAGPPGVGKTTLAQWVKARAIEADYWATDELVPVYPGDSAEHLLGRLLGNVYDAAVAQRPAAADNPALRDARQLVRVARLESVGGGVSALGIGASLSHGTSAVTPTGALLLDGPRVLRELLAFVRGAGAKGVVVHLNNLENLSERDAAAAADVLRSLRDTVLLQPGLHTLVVGTTEAVLTVTTAHAQLRSVFATPLVLAPLSPDGINRLLAARYDYLMSDRRHAATPPVAPRAVSALARLFRGDLRSLLKALDEGASVLIGIGRGKPGTPLAEREIRPVLQIRYEQQMRMELPEPRVLQLRAWAQNDPAAHETQDSLRVRWKRSQGGVSKALRDLIVHGYVVALPRTAGQPATYALSGASRLIFG
ncbi:MAG TPA: hypothetical protein VFW89_05070 [Gemmatimonadaceae bacterium]|nr:hypothetical protein [Gemmatimonadaceae bacterium]